MDKLMFLGAHELARYTHVALLELVTSKPPWVASSLIVEVAAFTTEIIPQVCKIMDIFMLLILYFASYYQIADFLLQPRIRALILCKHTFSVRSDIFFYM